jgi:hypothetical protein
MEIVFDHSMAPHVLPTAHISPRMLGRVVEVMREFYPDAWLAELKAHYEKNGHLAFKHPIYTGLLKGVSIDTVTVAEIAACLNRLRGKVNLGKIVEEMRKSDSFDDYFYQLVTSHRLSHLDPDLLLEPLLEGKTPDIAFTFGGVPCIAECSIIKDHTVYARFHECMEYLAQVVFREAQKRDLKKTVKIEVTHESIIRKREAVEATVVKLMEAGQNTTVELDCCKVSMTEIDDIPEHDFGFAESILTREEYAEFYDSMLQGNEDKPGEHASMRFLVSYRQIAKGIEKDFVEKLDAKIQSKREQVKILKEKGYMVFLFVDTDISWRKMEKDKVGQVMEENLKNLTSDVFSMITLTNKPRGSLDPFALNRITADRTRLPRDWWEKFWHGFMDPSATHKFRMTADRNEPCPCGIGLKHKHCHGSF